MLYEQGKWTLAPTPEFVAELGQPIAQIIAAEKASGRCDEDAPSSSTSTVTTTSDSCAETGYCHFTFGGTFVSIGAEIRKGQLKRLFLWSG